MSRKLIRTLNPEETKFEYPHLFHYENRLKDALKEKGNTTNLSPLKQKFKELCKGKEVWDFGGSGGLAYFTLKPENAFWVVWEVPETVDYMRQQIIDDHIIFEYTRDILKKQTDREVGFYTSKTIHYLKNPLKFLKDNVKKIDFLLLNSLYCGRETRLVEQEDVGPCWIIGLDDIKEILEKDFNVFIREEKGQMWEVNNTDVIVYPNHDILAIRK